MMGTKLSDFSTTNTLSSADKFPIVRGSGGNSDNLNVPYSVLQSYLQAAMRPDVAGLKFVASSADLPDAVSGVITLEANTAYLFTTTIDFNGDRLVCGGTTTILGTSSETSVLKSTGLTGNAFLTSAYTTPIQNISFEGFEQAIDLSGDGTTALDWYGVNFIDCDLVGTVQDQSNFIVNNCAFLNSGALTIDGTVGTVGFSSTLFTTATAGTSIIIPATATITRRFRVIYSSFVSTSGETSINVNASATIPDESYILDTCNFSGGGTYITGVAVTSNTALFVRCVGITNTAANGQAYMQNNATATTISDTTSFVKIAGTTSASSDNSKFTHTDNRLTCAATITRKYLIQATLSFTAGNNNVCEFGFYDSTLAAVRTPSKTKSTANTAGRAENITMSCVTTLSDGDYIEVHCKNTSAVTNITCDALNLLITEIV